MRSARNISKGPLSIRTEYTGDEDQELIYTGEEEKWVRICQMRVIVKQGETVRELQNLLPPAWSVWESCVTVTDAVGHGTADHDEQRIILPRNVREGRKNAKPYFEENGTLFVFLHEAGHAHHPVSPPTGDHPDTEAWDEMRAMEMICGATGTGDAAECELNRKYSLVPEFRAWMHALKTIEYLRQEGIDFEPHMTIEELRRQAVEAFRTYMMELVEG